MKRSTKKIIWGIGLALIAVAAFSVVAAYAQTASPVPTISPTPSSVQAAGNSQSQTQSGGYGAARLPVIGHIVAILLYLILYVISGIIKVTAWLLSFFLDYNTQMLDPSSPSLPFITTGWGIFRDIANLGFVFGIVVVAVGTILRIKSYQIQALLPKIIIAALIVNFSLLIGGAVLKVSDVFSNYLLAFIQGDKIETSAGVATGQKITDAFRFNEIINAQEVSQANGVWETILAAVAGPTLFEILSLFLAVLFGIAIILTLVGMAGMLALRYFNIAFLLVLAPGAYLLWIFPSTKKYFSEWWEKFIHWAFYPPLILLFIYLSLTVLTGVYSGAGSGSGSMSYEDAATKTLGNQSVGAFQFGKMINTLMAIFLLLGGLQVAQKMGYGGTKLVLNAADKAQKWGKKYATTKMKRGGARVGRSALKGIGGLREPVASKIESWGSSKSKWKRGLAGASRTFVNPVMRATISGEASLEKKSQEYIDEKKKKYEGYSPDRLKAILRSSRGEERAAVAQLIADKNKLGDHTKDTAGLGMVSETYESLTKLGKKKDADDFLKKVGLNDKSLKALRSIQSDTSNNRAPSQNDIDELKREQNKVRQDMTDDEYKTFAKNTGRNIAMGEYFGMPANVANDVVRDGFIKEDALHDPSKLRQINYSIKDAGELKKHNGSILDEKLKWMDQYITEYETDLNTFTASVGQNPSAESTKRIERMRTDLSKMRSERQKFGGEYLNQRTSGNPDYTNLVMMMSNSKTSTVQEMRDFARTIKIS